MVRNRGWGVPIVLLMLALPASAGFFWLDYEYVNVSLTTPDPTVWYRNTTVYPSGKVVDGFLIDMPASGAIGNEVVLWVDATPDRGGQFKSPDQDEILGDQAQGDVKKFLTSNFGYWYIYILLPDGSVTLKARTNETVHEMLSLINFEWRDQALSDTAESTEFVVLPSYAS